MRVPRDTPPGGVSFSKKVPYLEHKALSRLGRPVKMDTQIWAFFGILCVIKGPVKMDTPISPTFLAESGVPFSG